MQLMVILPVQLTTTYERAAAKNPQPKTIMLLLPITLVFGDIILKANTSAV